MSELNNFHNKPPLVSIIIANFNGERFIPDCLESVLKSKFSKFEVIICDDGSTDKSVKIINRFIKKDPRIKLLINKTNLGAAASRNNALEVVRGEIIIFLDNDTRVDSLWINEILKPFKQRKVGGVQAVLLDFEQPELIQMAGGKMIYQLMWHKQFLQWLSYTQNKKTLKQENIIAVSAALAVRRRILLKIAGFDEKEAVSTEDLDLCWRICLLGYDIVLAPKSIIYHWHKSMSDRKKMLSNHRHIYFHMSKNTIRSIIKNYEFVNILRYLPLAITILFLRGLIFIFMRRKSDALLGFIDAVVWNIVNLKDTLEVRSNINMFRKVSDRTFISRYGYQVNIIDTLRSFI